MKTKAFMLNPRKLRLWLADFFCALAVQGGTVPSPTIDEQRIGVTPGGSYRLLRTELALI